MRKARSGMEKKKFNLRDLNYQKELCELQIKKFKELIKIQEEYCKEEDRKSSIKTKELYEMILETVDKQIKNFKEGDGSWKD